MDISAIQIAIVLVIALLVFGPKRLPDLARQVGRGIREMKQQVNAMSDEVRAAVDSEAPAASPPRDVPVATQPAESDDDLLEGIVVSGDTGPGGQTQTGS